LLSSILVFSSLSSAQTHWSITNTLGSLAINSTWGKGVTIYVVDSGTNTTAQHFRNIVSPSGATTDVLGHGIRMIDVMKSPTYGLAQHATIKSIKIAHSSANFTEVNLIRAIREVANDTVTGMKIMNLSGLIKLDSYVMCALQWAYHKKVVAVRAAGNDDSGTRNPTPFEFLVGGYDEPVNGKSRISAESSYNGDVDIYAPWTASSGVSGTSVSAAIVSAAMAAAVSYRPTYLNNPISVYNYMKWWLSSKSLLDPTDPKLVGAEHKNTLSISALTTNAGGAPDSVTAWDVDLCGTILKLPKTATAASWEQLINLSAGRNVTGILQTSGRCTSTRPGVC
jgi:hypothetical protein